MQDGIFNRERTQRTGNISTKHIYYNKHVCRQGIDARIQANRKQKQARIQANRKQKQYNRLQAVINLQHLHSSTYGHGTTNIHSKAQKKKCGTCEKKSVKRKSVEKGWFGGGSDPGWGDGGVVGGGGYLGGEVGCCNGGRDMVGPK